MASSSRISYPLVWGIVFSTLAALLLGWIVVARTQVATTPTTPVQRNLTYWVAMAKNNKLDSGVQTRLGYAYYRAAQEQTDPAKKKAYFEKALAAYDASIVLNPKVSTSKYNKAITLRDLGRNDEALKVFLEVVKMNNEKTQATHDVGMLYMQRGDTKSAVKWLEKSVRAEPMASDYRRDLATAYAKVGRYRDAISQLTYAKKMSPADKEIQSMLTSLTAAYKKSGGN
jgi:tetratricopeptide (TPR) repeat protein